MNVSESKKQDFALMQQLGDLCPELYRELIIRAETVVDIYKAQQQKKEEEMAR